MDRLWLMPSLVEKKPTFWRKVLYGLAITSIEAFLALACLLTGLPVLIDPTRFAPVSIRALDAWLIYPWGVGMLTGGTLTLSGIVSSHFRVERMGIAILAFVAFTYIFALFTALPASLFVVMSYALFSLAMLARYWVLGRMIKQENAFRHQIKVWLQKDGE